MSTPYFSSRYPILAAIMNGGSDLNFAVACHEAGIFPSLLANCDSDTYSDELNELLKEFRRLTGSTDINVGIQPDFLVDPVLVQVIKSNQLSHIEFYDPRPVKRGRVKDKRGQFGEAKFNEMRQVFIKHLQDNGVKIMSRSIKPHADFNYAYCLKGSGAAGFNSDLTTMELFKQQRALTPNAVLIPYGGVGTASQVREFIDLGAAAVGVGTVLAASVESSLSMETKQAMVRATKEDIVKMPDTGQNSLIFGNAIEVIENTDPNRQSSLNAGLQGHGGHMYVGTGIDYVTEILPVKDIVERLVSEL